MTSVRIRRGFAFAAALVVLFVVVVGFAHTRAGRPLLVAMGRAFRGGGAACPLGYDKTATPAEHEQANARFATLHRGAATASARPALGFVLGETSRGEIVSRMAARGIACERSRAADLVCKEVPSAALGGVSGGGPSRELWFTFGTRDELLWLVALARAPNAGVISAAFNEATQVVADRAGPATRTSGAADAATLASGVLRQASAEFRFTNYYAEARATNIGSGYLLTEEYRSLVD